MDSTFAEKLKEARNAAGLTQQAMAERMLIPKRTIEAWEMWQVDEKGKGRIPPPYVQRFVLNELEARKKEESEIFTDVFNVIRKYQKLAQEGKSEIGEWMLKDLMHDLTELKETYEKK